MELTPHVELVRDQVPRKLDLLMMIDNSISMADKQQLLADAMQHLVDRLIEPRCLDQKGMPTGKQATPAGDCPLGSQPEFLPFNDIHAGVVTSSLGSHGATGSGDICMESGDDDHAQLLGVIRQGLTAWNQQGFLAWDPEQRLTPVGTRDPGDFATQMAQHVTSAGEHGCGYESTLEAWYRFLIDPEPPAAVVLPAGTTQSVVQGTSAEVLAERAAFLRPDSVLGIVMLSDENDCSIVDGGYGWLVARSASSGHMLRSSSACAANPNDPCCQSCASASANPGCPALTSDPECAKGTTLDAAADTLNLRCYAQKRRFGIDLLYPVQRYVDGLTSAQVQRRSDGQWVTNPIYRTQEGVPPRSPEQVLLLGIVGVPWQDVAEPDSLTSSSLKWLSESGQLPADRWDVILGDPDASPPILPLDPFMVETPVDRTTLPIAQTNPLVSTEKLAPATSTNPQANHINGHELVNTSNDDLQYACTFQLPTPLACDATALNSNKGCDCYASAADYNRPLCQPAEGGAYGTTQYFGKGYPGLRELSVLKRVGGHGIVASICAKTADVQSDSYGYRPAMDALTGRIAHQIGRSCLTRDARVDAAGHTPCTLVTATTGGTCSCPAAQGLATPPPEVVAPVLEQLKSVGYCGPGMSCDGICLCALGQLNGSALSACQNADTTPEVPGFCYLNAVDGEAQIGRKDLAADCAGAAPRRIRFTGGAPGAGKLSLLYCPN